MSLFCRDDFKLSSDTMRYIKKNLALLLKEDSTDCNRLRYQIERRQ